MLKIGKLGVLVKFIKNCFVINFNYFIVLIIIDGKIWFCYFLGWRSIGCEVLDCFLDCNNRGVCNIIGLRLECIDC